MLKKGDFIFVSAIICIVIFIYVFSQFVGTHQADRVQIKMNGNIVYEVNIKEVKKSFIIKIPLADKGSDLVQNKGSDLTQLEIEIMPNGVRVMNAKCPDQVCVKTGTITNAGESIICVPNRVEVALVGEKNSEVDGVVY